MVLSNVVLWRFTAPGFQPVPNRPQEVSVPLTPLLSGLPLLLAAMWLGIGPTVLLSGLSGFIQAGFQSGEITQRFEVIAFGLLVAVFIRQNYRGAIGRWLRQPIIAAPVAALVSWPIMLPGYRVHAGQHAGRAELCLAAIHGRVGADVDRRSVRRRHRPGNSTGSPAMGVVARPAHCPALGADCDRPAHVGVSHFTAMLIIVLVYAVSAIALSKPSGPPLHRCRAMR